MLKTMKFLRTVWGLALLVTGIAAVPLWGQAVASAEIAGAVTDPSGAAVANAAVTATQTETNVVRSTVSGVNGSYVMPNLPIGPYTLEVTANGFTTYVRKGIILSVGTTSPFRSRYQSGR